MFAATAFLDFDDGYRLYASSASFPGSGQVADDGDMAFLGSVKLPNFILDGTVEANPGAVVTATVNAAPSGAIQLDGDRPGDFGELFATNPLNIMSVALTLSNPTFQPTCGSPILAMKASTLTGPFSSVQDNNLPSGGSPEASYSKTMAKVTIDCPVPAVAEDQTYGTGSGIDEVNPSGYYAEPVNTGTGAFSTQQTDAQLGGLGVTFGFTRYYSSDNTSSGPLGPGWSDSYDISLEPDGSTVSLTSENGQQSTFYQQSNGSYMGAAGVDSQLSQAGDGDWLLIRRTTLNLPLMRQGSYLLLPISTASV